MQVTDMLCLLFHHVVEILFISEFSVIENATLSLTCFHCGPAVTVIIIVVIVNANSYFDNGENTSDTNWANHIIMIF